MAVSSSDPSARARELVAELAPAANGSVDYGARLSDIGFDSLAFAELAAVLEDELGADLGPAELSESATAGDLLRAVERAGRIVRPTGVPPGIGRLQTTAEALGGSALGWWFSLEVHGAHRVPRRGPAVLTMNHESALDIPLGVVASPRPITFMAKRELFKNRLVTRFLHELGGFKVDRDRFDLAAVRIALALIDRGDVLGMYPEGTRAPGELLPFLPGAAWVALRTGAPIVPAAIAGTERIAVQGARLPRRTPVRVSFGEPISVDPVKDRRERRAAAEGLIRQVRASIEGLLGFG